MGSCWSWLEPRLAFAVLLLFVSGLGHGYSLGLDSLILRNAPDGLRDRVFTVYGAGLMAIQGLGFAAAGALAEVVLPHVAIVLAAGCGFATIACFRTAHARCGEAAVKAVRMPAWRRFSGASERRSSGARRRSARRAPRA